MDLKLIYVIGILSLARTGKTGPVNCECTCNLSCKCQCGALDRTAVTGSGLGISSQGENDVKLDELAWTHAVNGDIIYRDKEDRSGIIGEHLRWKDKTMIYYFDPSVPWNQQALYRDAVKYISSVSCVKFKEAQQWELNILVFNWVRIYMPAWTGHRCSSLIGMQGGAQVITVTGDCFSKTTLIHETLHALGFNHEQTRSDRDLYVYVDPSVRDNLNYKIVWSDSFGSPYDYTSVMHYPAINFAFGNHRTMWKVFYGSRIESSFGRESGDMSKEDITQLKKMYKC